MEYLEKRLAVAIETARIAGKFALAQRKEGNFNIYNKHENDFVTDVDRNTEKLIYSNIKEKFPNDGFFGEESGDDIGDGRWVVDPIDGTTNFFRGLPNWAISIAFELEKYKPLLGVIYLPCMDEMYYGIKEKGAFLNDKPIKCSNISDLDKSLIVSVLPHRHRAFYEDYNNKMKKIGISCSDIRSFGSCAQELVYIASGVIDGYYELCLGYYDFAAGQVILEEAGGKLVNSSKIKDFNDNNCDVLASNKLIHNQLEKIVIG